MIAKQFAEVFLASLRELFRGRVPFAALLIGTPPGVPVAR